MDYYSVCVNKNLKTHAEIVSGGSYAIHAIICQGP